MAVCWQLLTIFSAVAKLNYITIIVLMRMKFLFVLDGETKQQVPFSVCHMHLLTKQHLNVLYPNTPYAVLLNALALLLGGYIPLWFRVLAPKRTPPE